MSVLGFLLKPKHQMAKENTRYIRVGKYTLTSHAQNRIVDKARKMGKADVLENLFTKPNGVTQIKYDGFGRPSYNRVGKRATTSINPTNNKVVSCRPVSKQDRRDFNLVNIGKKGRKRKYVKRNSEKSIYRKGER